MTSETRTRWGRRTPGGPFWLALLLIPLLLALIAAFAGRGGIQDDLTSRAQAALKAAGITGANVDFDGRDGTIELPAGADAAAAEDAVLDVDGVRVVDVTGGGTGDGGDGGDGDAAAPYSVTIDKGEVVVKATVPTDAAKAELLEAAKGVAGDKKVIDQVTVTDGAIGPDASGVRGLLDGLADDTGTAAVWDGTKLTLTGEVPSEEIKSEIGTAAQTLVDLSGPGTVANELVVKAAASPSPSAEPSEEPSDAECDDLNAALAAIQTKNKIQFAESSPQLTARSRSAVADIASLLKACAGTAVEVGGHTDNQGDPSTSKPLSQARARAVRTALIKLGVDAAQITAVGYGESKPIASNNTADGRAANRRVDITVK